MSTKYVLSELSDSESSSSDTSSSSDEETPQVAMKVEKIYESTKEIINSSPRLNVASVSNPERKLRLSKKILSKWPVDDLLQLVERMKDTLPENDSLKFSKQVKKIVWDDIAFNDHSGNDCSSVWSTIQKSIRKNRILKEILSDAEEAICKIPRNLNKKRINRHPEQPKRPLSAYLIFCAEKREEVHRENPGIKNTDAVKLIATMFNNLSEHDRRIYTNREEELKKTYEEQLKEFHMKYPKQTKEKMRSPTNKPQTPFQIYYERQIKSVPTSLESESVVKKQCKENWKNMNKDEKLVFINLAVENERKFYKELEDSEEKPKYKSILSKEERLLSDNQAGKPKKPPHSAYGLFTQVELKKEEMKKLNIKERMKLVGTRWNNCPQEIKAKYISESSELKAKYKSDYDGYLKSLTEEQRQEETQPKSKKRKLSPKDNKVNKKKKTDLPEQNNLVKPERPPSAAELFAKTHFDKNLSFEQAWLNLSKIEQRKYKRKVSQLHSRYLTDFDAYVKATMEKQRSETEITSTITSEEDAETSTASSSSSSDNSNNESEKENRENSEDSSSNSSNPEESTSCDEDSSSDSN